MDTYNSTLSTVFDINEEQPIYTTTTEYSSSFWIALGTSVITNLIQAFALSYQRKSHLLNELSFPRKSAWKRPMWLIAFISFTTANIVGSVFSIGYLPVVILAPIGAMNLVFNAFAANIVLGDPLSRQGILGTGLIAFGALLVGFFGVVPEPNHSLSDLILLYRKPGFIVYFTILETFIVATMLVTHYLEYCCALIELRQEEDITPKKVVHGYSLEEMKRYIGISYGILSGNVSSQSMLFAKSGIELIILTIAYDENQLQYPLTWFLLFMMILTGGMQLYYLNKGLRLCDTMTLIPLSFCAFNVSCLFNGLVYYNQWDRFRWWQLMYVMSGVVVTIFGVLLLSWQSTPTTTTSINEPSSLIEDLEYVDNEDGDSHSSQVNLLVKKKRRNDVYIQVQDDSK